MVASRILTLNGGSSSLKYAVFEGATCPLARCGGGTVERLGAGDYSAVFDEVVSKLALGAGFAGIDAIGHRVVHGGDKLVLPVPVTPDTLAELRQLVGVDPDHLPAEIALIEAIQTRAPHVLQVACFDTAFHSTILRVARLLPLPRRYESEGVHRYGFHGLSYQYLIEELARRAGERVAMGRVVLAHLGSGASLAAVREGRCVDTTMAYSPNSGIPMGTRSGDLDPGVLMHILREERMSVDALDDMLNRRSGLLGVSETSADMRDLLERERTDSRAADAVALFCWHVRKAVGALATTLGGLDVLVCAGGIGEHAAPVRARVAEGLQHLGVVLDKERNDTGEAVVSPDGSACMVHVIRTDEESIIARETLRILSDATNANANRGDTP